MLHLVCDLNVAVLATVCKWKGDMVDCPLGSAGAYGWRRKRVGLLVIILTIGISI